MTKRIAGTLLAFVLCMNLGACAAPRVSGAQSMSAPPGSPFWGTLGTQSASERYDYPGPALTGGCVC